MKHFLLFLLLLTSAILCRGGEHYCRIVNFDEEDGLSQRLVKGVVQDRDGVVWIGTWNGLNRFDGTEFKVMRPAKGDSVSRYSSRIGELRLGPDGNLLFRIDARLTGFDVRTHRFSDLHSRVERALGHGFAVRNILTTDEGPVVIQCQDGSFITLTPEGLTESRERPHFHFTNPRNRKLGDVGPYLHQNLVFSQRDESGRIWLITRDGEIVTAPSTGGPFTVLNRVECDPASLYYCLTDRQGNIWLRSSEGISLVTLGTRPYRRITPSPQSMVRASYRDNNGRIWLAESDTKGVAVCDSALNVCRYLGADGKLSERFTPFGHAVYAISGSPDGTMWLGSKPDGLFRLRPEGGGYEITHFSLPSNNVYDILPDNRGRLWVATMGAGLFYAPDYRADRLNFINLSDKKGYPAEAIQVRHLQIVGDTMLIASTTSGLLILDPATIGSPALRASLHVSEPGRATSLGNIAVMDVAPGPDGTIIATTESDGVNIATPAAIDRPEQWQFSHHNASEGLADVALSVMPLPGKEGNLLVVSSNRVFLFNPSAGTAREFGPWLWGDGRIRFSDARPLPLPGGDVLLGHDKGAVVFSPSTAPSAENLPVMFTSASIENRPDTLLSFATQSITLGPDERNLTLRFATLDYSGAVHRYAYSIDGGEPVEISSGRSLTFLDLKPGTFEVTVISSTAAGEWSGSEAKITVTVTPAFYETTLAKILYVLATLLIIGLTLWTVLYIRAIRRKQRETLQAYMELLEKSSATAAAPEPRAEEEHTAPSVSVALSDDDKRLMDKVMQFVNDRMADSEVTVDDMADAVGMSRSTLNRKMKAMTGLSPAEFLRESRLSHAAGLLVSTDLPIKEIAIDCGFADLNYFGKCFKSSRSLTPGAYRKSHR